MPPQGEPIAVERLDPAALAEAAALLAEAFGDNPLNVAVIGPDPARRRRSNRAGLDALLPVACREALVLGARRGGGLLGALVATPPLAHPLPLPALAQRVRLLLRQGWRVARRWADVYERLDARHPRAPHWYLGTVGVAAGARGAGVGRALVVETLCLADRDGVPVYLETDRAENVAFYERLGFRLLHTSRLLGVEIWHMQRAATQ